MGESIKGFEINSNGQSTIKKYDYNSLDNIPELDTTLTSTSLAAQGKIVGDEIIDLKNTLSSSNAIQITIGRYNAIKKTQAISTDAKTCFTSLIPCTKQYIRISYYQNYPFLVHLYNSNLELIASDIDWIRSDKIIQNLGGYIVIVYSKVGWIDLIQEDVDYLLSQINYKDSQKIMDALFINNDNNIYFHLVSSSNPSSILSNFIFCNTNKITIPAISGYGFVYSLYNENLEFIESFDGVYGLPIIVNNKNGYIQVRYYKIANTITNEDVNIIQSNFKIQNRIDEIEQHENKNITFTCCYRCDIPSKKVNLSNNIQQRCFTSFIYCQEETFIVPHIMGYNHIVYLFDKNKEYIRSITTDFDIRDEIVQNKGGFIVVLFAKNEGFTNEDLQILTKIYNQNENYNLKTYNIFKMLNARYFQPTVTIGNYDIENKRLLSGNEYRCFTSLIPCSNYTIIQQIPGYRFIVYLYDLEGNFISSDNSWTIGYKIVDNPNGYMSLVFFKEPYQTIFNLEDIDYIKKNILKSIYRFEIGVWSQARKAVNASEKRCTMHPYLCSETITIIPFIPGYPFYYWLYDSQMNLIEKEDTYAQYFSKKIQNKGGYLVVTFAKTNADDFTAEDVTFLSNNFNIQTQYDELLNEIRKNYTFAFAYRFNILNKTGSVQSSNPLERCLSSMIRCKTYYTYIPFIAGYNHVIYLFDKNKEYIDKYPKDETFKSGGSTIQNYNGYIAIVWMKTGNDKIFTNLDRSILTEKMMQLEHLNGLYNNKNYQIPVLTLLDDDGRVGYLDDADMLEQRGLSGTFAVIASNTDGNHNTYMTLQQVLSLRDRGFDCISHTNTHSQYIYGNNYSGGRYCNFSLVEDETIKNDLKQARTFQLKYGLNADALAWPWGNYPISYDKYRNNPDPNDSLVIGADNQRLRYAKIAREVGFKYAVNSTGGSIFNSDFDDMWIPRETLQADDNQYPLSYYTTRLDIIKNRGGWCILMTHASDPVYANLTKLTAIVDYALAHEIQVLNLKDAYQIKRHTISLGFKEDPYHYYFIGGDGISHF